MQKTNVYLSDGQSAISLQNGFSLHFSFKTCSASDLASLYNVSELTPLLQGYATLLEHAIRQYIL